jgi:hypothetical protein
MIDSTPASLSECPLTEDQIFSWKNRGYALVDGVLPMDLLNEVKSDACSLFPKPGSDESKKFTDFGGADFAFPSPKSPAMNQVPLHPRILRCVSSLLDVDVSEIRLSKCLIVYYT